MLARIERGRRQFVPAFLRLIIDDGRVADFPDEVIGGFSGEPQLQHVADAEALILTSEEAPRALQLAPELHEAFLGVFNVHHKRIRLIRLLIREIRGRKLSLVLLRLHIPP